MTKATEQEPVATQMNLVLNWSKELRPCALSRKARGSTQGRGSDRLTASVGNYNVDCADPLCVSHSADKPLRKEKGRILHNCREIAMC